MVKTAYQVSIGVNTSEGYVYFADGRYSGAFGGGCGSAPNDYNNNSSMVTQDPRVSEGPPHIVLPGTPRS